MELKIKIREARIEDTPIILKGINGLASHVGQEHLVTATEQDIRNTIFASGSHVNVFVSENEDGEITGFAVILKTFSTFKAKTNFYLEDLFVFPEYRNKGIGEYFLNFIKEYAKRRGAGILEWYVNKANKLALDFYAKMGAKTLDYKSIY